MRIITRYLLLQMLWPALLALPLLAGLVWLLQALRLGHHLLGGDGALLGPLLLRSLPTLLVFACPLALAAAVIYTLGRLAASNQLLALRAVGISPLQLARPVLLLGLAFALLTLFLTARLESPALRGMSRLLRQHAPRALLGAMTPRRFNALLDDDALYFEGRLPAAPDEVRLTGLLLAQAHPPRLLLARQATARFRPDGVVELRLLQGELQLQGPRGLRRLRFAAATVPLDLRPALRPHLAFLDRHAALAGERTLLAPLSCLVLGLLSTVIGLRRERPLRLAATGLLAVSGFELASWGVQILGEGPAGAVLLGVAVGSLSLAWLARS